MSHAALVNDVVFWLVAFLTLLLVMFIGAVIWMPLGPPPPLHRPARTHTAGAASAFTGPAATRVAGNQRPSEAGRSCHSPWRGTPAGQEFCRPGG
jgi:hypothetical protein